MGRSTLLRLALVSSCLLCLAAAWHDSFFRNALRQFPTVSAGPRCEHSCRSQATPAVNSATGRRCRQKCRSAWYCLKRCQRRWLLQYRRMADRRCAELCQEAARSATIAKAAASAKVAAAARTAARAAAAAKVAAAARAAASAAAAAKSTAAPGSRPAPTTAEPMQRPVQTPAAVNTRLNRCLRRCPRRLNFLCARRCRRAHGWRTARRGGCDANCRAALAGGAGVFRFPYVVRVSVTPRGQPSGLGQHGGGGGGPLAEQLQRVEQLLKAVIAGLGDKLKLLAKPQHVVHKHIHENGKPTDKINVHVHNAGPSINVQNNVQAVSQAGSSAVARTPGAAAQQQSGQQSTTTAAGNGTVSVSPVQAERVADEAAGRTKKVARSIGKVGKGTAGRRGGKEGAVQRRGKKR